MQGVAGKDGATADKVVVKEAPPREQATQQYTLGPTLLAYAQQVAAREGKEAKLTAEGMPSDAEMRAFADFHQVSGSVIASVGADKLAESVLARSEEAKAWVEKDPEHRKQFAALVKLTVEYHEQVEALAPVDKEALAQDIAAIQQTVTPKPWYRRWAANAWWAITWMKWARSTGETVHSAVTIMNSPAFQILATGLKVAAVFAI